MNVTHGTKSSYVAGCRCEICRDHWRIYQGKYRRPKSMEEIAELWPDFKHGAKVGYSKGCRCESCISAHRATSRDNITKRQDRFKENPDTYGHGNGTAYQAGCRCEMCRLSQSEHGRRRKYGLSPDDIETLMEKQGGCCAICRRPFVGGNFNVDHDHATGAIRDLLCITCNTGLGKFGDSIEELANAIAYLERHRKAADKL